MILYPIKLLTSLRIPTTVIVGHQQEAIKTVIGQDHHQNISFSTQTHQRGTADAVACSADLWEKDHILILNGDIPLLTAALIKELYRTHITTKATVSFVTSHYEQPSSFYGRVFKKNKKMYVVEAAEFEGDPGIHCCISPGIYLVKKEFLIQNIQDLVQDTHLKECYISTLIEQAITAKKKVTTVAAPFDTVRGINNLRELWTVEHIKRAELISFWMEHGVRFAAAQNIGIDINVSIGAGTIIGAGAQLLGDSTIGKNCTVGTCCTITNAHVDHYVDIAPYSLIEQAHIESNVTVGPYAYIHANTTIKSNAEIGNFVEIKRSYVGNKSKIKHLSYLGDAEIGAYANIGAGTITCNYDGINKNPTVIQDHAFIGTNNSLVAPVTVGKHAFTAAGSVITQDVPDQALAIARARQVNKEKYHKKKINKSNASKKSITPFIAATKSEHDQNA